MRNLLSIAALFVSLALSAQGIVPSGESFVTQLQPRDSILVADQLEYGLVLEDPVPGASYAFPDFSKLFNDTLVLVRSWQIDTLVTKKQTSIRASIVVAPFEAGVFVLPPLPVQRVVGDVTDTLLFDPQTIEVKTIPVDTATFEIHDLKGQIRYPVTFRELIPYFGAALLLAALVVLTVYLVRRYRSRRTEPESKDPDYIVALRRLEKYRGDKYWAPDKQKLMYSGITDILRTYIESRFGVNAEEMTTAEIFDGLKSCAELTPDLYQDVKELFELSDFVKFAKHTASDEDNAKAIPTAVRFVTSTNLTENVL